MRAFAVATYNAMPPAKELQQLLREGGFKAYIHDESFVERFWFWSEPLAAIHVEVAESDYPTATRLVHEMDASKGVLHDAVRCPDCRSSRVEFPQITRKFLTPVVQVLLMTFHVIPRHFYCVDCHFTWPKEAPKEIERDVFDWPVSSKPWHPGRMGKAKRG
jgi:rubredoxin